jgi:hypothetical protein
MRKSMTRARRSAVAVRRGPEILEFLLSDEARKTLRNAAERGEPPVTAVSETLRRRFGTDMRLPPVRQFVGLVIRAVLEEEGFRVAESGVRISRDPIFRTGAVYEAIADEKKAGSLESLVAFLTEKLSDSEIGRLRQLLSPSRLRSR